MQTERVSPADGRQAAEAVKALSEPLISGPAELLWIGAGAVIVVFTLVFYLLLRGRVGRRLRNRDLDTDFFKPAGEGAEITFEESVEPAAERLPPAMREPAPVESAPAPIAPKKKSSAFAGLFSRKPKAEESVVPIDEAPEPLDGGHRDLATVHIERPDEPSRSSVFGSGRGDPAREADEREAARLAAERVASERDARLAEEDARRRAENDARRRMEFAAREREIEIERRRREEEERSRAAPAWRDEPRAVQGTAAPDDIARTLSEVEEALHVQRETIQAETRSLLDSFARRFSDRLDALSQSAETRGAQGLAAAGSAAGGLALDGLAREFADHRSQVTQTLAAFGRELSMIRDAIGGHGVTGAPVVQLGDIVRGALPPGSYELGATLKNRRRADCVVRLPFPPGPIAIDARFPVEAFHQLRQGRNGAATDAETEFRRVALRHIVDIAERLISPGETAESAIMFLPSEAMYSEIHARFPDVVQDSYRARVWITSPTTLMATLHTMRGVLKDAGSAEAVSFMHGEAAQVLAELDRLRARVIALEENVERARQDARDIASTTDEAYRRAEAITGTVRPRTDYAPQQRMAEPAPEPPSALAPEPAMRPARRYAPEEAEIELKGDLFAEETASGQIAIDPAKPPPVKPLFPLR
jgi:DNA recombination protein RmuC